MATLVFKAFYFCSHLVGHVVLPLPAKVESLHGDVQVFERPLALGHHQPRGDLGELRVVPETVQDQSLICGSSARRIHSFV